MAPQPFPVAPLAGVVDQNRVAYAVFGVIHVLRRVGIDDTNHVAVGDDRVFFLVDGYDAVKGTVHRIAAQKARPFDQVVLAPLANNRGAQAKLLAAAGLLYQYAGQQTADAAETVQHDILRLLQKRAAAGVDGAKLAAHEIVQAKRPFLRQISHRQSAEVYARRRQVQPAEGFENGECLQHGQLAVENQTGKAVRLEDLDSRAVHQRAAVHGGHDIVVAVQVTDERQHALCKLLMPLPFLQINFLFLSIHD